jgi:quercetin dioxygenase-like cupin family protein
MKLAFSAAALASAIIAFAPPVFGADDHKIYGPNDMKWSAGPGSIPKGAEFTVLHGDPSKEGLFAMRLKLPKGYAIPPHTHPKPEIVTVVSGTFQIGMGDTADKGKVTPLAAGGFFAFPPGMAHFAFTDEETIIQLNSTGPWALTYVNPKDDPRQKSQ